MCAEREKPKRKEDGLYWFICVECGKDFPAENPNAKTCGQRCRNAKNKRIKNKIEKTENEFTIKYKHNSKILRRLVYEKVIPVEMQTLELLNFNIDIKVLVEIKDGVQYQIFGDFAIGRISPTKFKIIPEHELQSKIS